MSKRQKKRPLGKARTNIFKENRKSDWEKALQFDLRRFPDVAGMLVQGLEINPKLLARAFHIDLPTAPKNWKKAVNRYIQANKGKMKGELLELKKKPCPVLSREK